MSFAVDNSTYLLLLLIAPAMWLWSYRSLAGLGGMRRILALTLRTLVLAAIVFALADMQFRKSSDRLTVIYLLDQSQSIPAEQREAMAKFVNATVRENRQDDKLDRAGVIVFGREAEVELPPVDFAYELPRVESLVDPTYTNLEAALQKAMSLFPADSAKRVVIVTDGNENMGDALREARAMADAGVSIDVLPAPINRRSEVRVDKVALPADVRRGEPFELRVVVDHDTTGAGKAKGKLRIIRKHGQQETTLSEAPVELSSGKNVFTVSETIEESDFYTYEARFVPDDKSTDASEQNNLATAFTHVRGKGQVLVIEDWEHPGEFDYLVQRLRSEGIEVTLSQSNQLFTSLPELQRYDCVVLANTPRSSGFGGDDGQVDTDTLSGFSDAQIEMLVRNTEELGCGLVMLGGDRSFGAGGWERTALEKAMPLDFQIKSAKVTPVGALAMIMHASEIAQGNYWQKRIAVEAIDALGARDYCGLLQWNGNEQWLWGQSQGGMIPVGPNRGSMKARVDRLVVGDMPDFDPGMKKAAAAFAGLTNPVPALKHMIIISDGDPTPPSGATIAALKRMSVKVTTVAVGAHGPPGHQTMQNIANQTGGKYYVVRNASALPKIYQREARRVARPLVKELEPALAPRLSTRHAIVDGIGDEFPPLSGFVMTTVKDSSLVEVILRSPEPPNAENSAVLASWTYGLGKVAAMTTDAGHRWANDWTAWGQYDRFYSQLIRWAMRPTGETGNFTIATEVGDGKTRVVIDALDKDEEFLNVASLTGVAVSPEMKSVPLVINQVAPGRYVGEFESDTSGSYMIAINAGGEQGLIRTGVSVGYSDEFRDRTTNTPLLETLAKLPAKGGEPGKLISAEAKVEFTGEERVIEPLAKVNSYRRDLPPAVASQPIWPLLVLLGSCVFFADVFIRRVQVGFEWLAPLWQKFATVVLRRQPVEAAPETMSRLRSRKREVQKSLEARQTETRLEIDETRAPTTSPLNELKQGPTAKREPAKPPAAEPKPDEKQDDYTSRLLKAKRDAKRKREE